VKRFGIEVRWPPTACPELNPLENLWRRLLEGRVLCSREAEQFGETVGEAVEILRSPSSAEVLGLTGIACGHLWVPTYGVERGRGRPIHG